MKASARKIMARAMESATYAQGDQDLWTQKLVKEALIAAFVTAERTTGRVGPRQAAAAWPVIADMADIWEQRRTGSNEIGRGARPQITSRAIGRSEMVLQGGRAGDAVLGPWLLMLEDYPEIRVQLEVYVLHEMAKEFGRTTLSISELCKRQGWAKSSFDRNVSTAAWVIADGLNRAGVEVW